MAVYVDPLFKCLPNANWCYYSACHMAADSDEELLAFAKSIGLKPEWFQNKDNGLHHFDLTPRKRKEAVAAGAKEISAWDLGLLSRYRRLKRIEEEQKQKGVQ